MGDPIKVGYLAREGWTSKAYVDSDSGKGEDKHTGMPIIVKWDEGQRTWIQVDTWEWSHNLYTDEWIRTN